MDWEKKFYCGKRNRILQIKDAIFQHGTNILTLRQFCDVYKYQLPKIVIVTQGYDGGMELDTIGMGQVMRIHSVCKQRRLIARDISGRNITIPLNYRLPFRVCSTKNKRGQGQLLSDIVSSHSLPVQVEFALSDECRFDVGNTETSVKSFGKITVSGKYDELYCIANCICDGILELQSILIPLYLEEVLVSVVTGIQDKTQEHFQQFVRDIELSAKGIIFGRRKGKENIALYKQVDVDTTQRHSIYDTLQPERFFRFAKGQEEYLTLSDSSHFKGENKSREKITQCARKEPVQAPLSQKPVYRKKPLKPPAEPPDNETGTDDIPPVLPPRHSVVSRETTSSVYDNSTSDYDCLWKCGYVRRGNEDYTRGRKDDCVTAGNSPDCITRGTSEAEGNNNDITEDRKNRDVSKDSSETDVKITSKEDHVTKNTEDNYARGKSVFKKNTTDLTIAELGEIMKALKLERHIDAFKKESVDGCLLADLNEHILKEEFKFTGIETVRMMKFIRTGHIPH